MFEKCSFDFLKIFAKIAGGDFTEELQRENESWQMVSNLRLMQCSSCTEMEKHLHFQGSHWFYSAF
jgi:hypothetical protein